MTSRLYHGMNQALATLPARCIAAILVCLSIGGTSVRTALADPPSHPSDYYAQTPAGTPPDDRAEIRGINAAPLVTAPAGSTVVRPDNRAGLRGIGEATIPSTEQPTLDASGFNWADAAIGAAAAAALILVSAGALFLAASRRHRTAGHLTIVERAEPITATSAHALVAEIVAAAVEPLDPVAHLVERDDKERQHDV